MSTILDKMIQERAADAKRAARLRPESDLLAEAAGYSRRSLAASLAPSKGTHVIAEIKRASPSAGPIRETLDPVAIARAYQAAGAAAISVLTEPHHFGGSQQDLRRVRDAVSIPVLRKDFLSTPYQISEAAAWGADVVLLIVAGLSNSLLHNLHAQALDLGLETLVEIHTEEELGPAIQCEGAIIGVNSRNLKTFKVDLRTAHRIAPHLPADRLRIAESGIRERSDILELAQAGYNGFLVGSILMQDAVPERKLGELLGPE